MDGFEIALVIMFLVAIVGFTAFMRLTTPYMTPPAPPEPFYTEERMEKIKRESLARTYMSRAVSMGLNAEDAAKFAFEYADAFLKAEKELVKNNDATRAALEGKKDG